MNMRIKSKWGQIIIDPERIYEVRIILNPWDNIYKVDFIMEGTFDVIPVELETVNEITTLVRRISNEMHFVKQYKFKDPVSGHLQINEPRRMQALKEKVNEKNNNVQ